jgi:Tfp pilus assembly protein PilE
MSSRRKAFFEFSARRAYFRELPMNMKMNYQHKHNERGIALLPVIIAVAALAVFGGGGAVVYQIQKSNEAETSALRQELQALQEQKEEETVGEETVEEENKEEESSSSALPATESEPAVKAATTSAPTINQPSTSDPNVPLIVEQEFEKVYGRKPSSSESNTWKNKYRDNSWSRSNLYDALIASKPKPAAPKPSAVQAASTAQNNTKSSAVSIELCKTNAKAEADKALDDALKKSPMLLELTASTKIRDIEQAALKYGVISQSEVPDIQSIYYGFKNSGETTAGAQKLTQLALDSYNSWLGDIQDNSQAQLDALRAKRDKAEEELYSKCLSGL